MKQINWKVSKSDALKITKIAQRASRLATEHGASYPVLEADMDVTACHNNGMPLDLDNLLAFDAFNFAHDVFGIRRHINRETGELENCFVPRCSAPRAQLECAQT